MMQQIVVLSDREPRGDNGMAQIGPRDQLIDDLESCNTGPAQPGEDVLYGPGFRLELAPGQDPITQMLLTIDDEDIAWIVIMRLGKRFGWKFFDPMSGRELKPR